MKAYEVRTAREAKRYVLERLAAEIRHHEANGSSWLYGEDEGDDAFPGPEERRVLRALREVADELDRRARRLR